MKYFRYTESENGMSDWGHAMLVDNDNASDHYGQNCYTFESDENTFKAETLVDIIIDKIKNGERDDRNYIDKSLGLGFTIEDIAEGANPADIVDSAELWDTELITWIFEKILEPRKIYALTTQNGAIVFDKKLLKEEDEIHNIRR